jgi:hypothetical protein
MRSKAGELRRKAVVTAAGAAVLGAGPALFMTHGHRWVGFVVIGIQIVLLVAAMRFLRESKRLRPAGRD